MANISIREAAGKSFKSYVCNSVTWVNIMHVDAEFLFFNVPDCVPHIQTPG